MRLRFALLAAITVLWPAGSAAAATVTFTQECAPKGGICVQSLAVVAAPGETNALSARATPDGVAFADAGATLTPEGGCRAEDDGSVHCPAGELAVTLGDGDDRFSAFGVAATALGGPGDDVLVGGDGDDKLTGGPGRDRLDGGVGDDTLHDRGTPADADVYAGGAGEDLVSYAGRVAGVRVTLPSSGADGDTLMAVEGAVGGRGADRLTGDESANTLLGRDGDDLLRGAGGDDVLRGGGGRDTAAGGAGDDGIWGTYGATRARCGSGNDILHDARRSDEARAGCERVFFAASVEQSVRLFAPMRAPTSPVARLGAFTCFERCGARLTLRTRGGDVVGRTVHPPARRSGVRGLTVALDRRGRERLARTGRLVVVLTFAELPVAEDADRGAVRLVLRAR